MKSHKTCASHAHENINFHSKKNLCVTRARTLQHNTTLQMRHMRIHSYQNFKKNIFLCYSRHVNPTLQKYSKTLKSSQKKIMMIRNPNSLNELARFCNIYSKWHDDLYSTCTSHDTKLPNPMKCAAWKRACHQHVMNEKLMNAIMTKKNYYFRTARRPFVYSKYGIIWPTRYSLRLSYTSTS